MWPGVHFVTVLIRTILELVYISLRVRDLKKYVKDKLYLSSFLSNLDESKSEINPKYKINWRVSSALLLCS